MFNINFGPDPQALNELNNTIDQFSEHVRNVVIRAGIKGATDVFKNEFETVAQPHRSKNNPPLRRDRRTGEHTIRQHLADAFTTKIWKIPDGSGFTGFAGPSSKDAPHGHLLEDGTGDRYHKSGHYTGAGPAYHLLKIAVARGIFKAQAAFVSAATEKLRKYTDA